MEWARERNSGVSYVHYDGDCLPFDDDGFDLVFAVCVSHNVPTATWQTLACEMHRVLRKNGIAIFLSTHSRGANPPSPMSRPLLEVADVFRDHGAAWRLTNAGHVNPGDKLGSGIGQVV